MTPAEHATMNDDRSRDDARSGRVRPQPKGWREHWYDRVLHAVRPDGHAIDSRRPRGRAGRDRPEDADSRPRSGRCYATCSACSAVPVDDVMVPRADIVARRRRHDAGRSARPLPHRRPFAPAGLRRDARRSRRAWSISATSSTSSPRRGRQRRPRRDKPRRPAEPRRSRQVDLSMRRWPRPRSCARCCSCRRSMPAIDLLVKMQATRTHMALVIDEYGGTDGLVSIEDLVEMVVGDIEDEHDDARGLDDRRRARRHRSSADARASLDEVSESARRRPRRREEAAEDIDTLGGLIVHPGRPRAGARRTDHGPGRSRIRDSRRRSAPGQTAAHPPARTSDGATPSRIAAAAGARPNAGAAAAKPLPDRRS